MAIVLATALSWLLERTDLPARNLFRAMILMPMATPPLLLAIGWALVLAPRIGIVSVAVRPLIGPIDNWFDIYSMPGVIFVQTLAYVPTSVLMLSPAIRALDPALEEAALVAGAERWQVLWRIGLPVLRPALLSVMTILLIVGMLCIRRARGDRHPRPCRSHEHRDFPPDDAALRLSGYGAAAAMNSILFVLLIGGLVLYRRTIRRGRAFRDHQRQGIQAGASQTGPLAQRAAVAFVGLYFLLAVLLPFVALLWASLIPYFAGFAVWRCCNGHPLPPMPICSPVRGYAKPGPMRC